MFDPPSVDAAQWARAAKSAGAKYLMLVAKHHDGFALWPTAKSRYSVVQSPWQGGKGDLVRMAADATRREGLGFGLYLSPWDRHEPRYADAKAYDDFYAGQLSELVQNYGPLVEWWLDGAGSAGHVYDFKRYVEELRTFQPDTLVFASVGLFDYGDIRWVGNEAGVVQGEGWNVVDRHGVLRWRPAEADTPLHKEQWFWHPSPGYAAGLKSVDELIENWEQSVGRGGQLVLGIAPDRRGLLPDADVDRLNEFGRALDARYGDAANVAARHAPPDSNAAAAFDNDPATFWSAGDPAHDELEIDLGSPTVIDHCLVMERLDDGQLVRRYDIQVWDGGAWKTVTGGQAIGHKRVHRFPAVTAQRVRLLILSSVGLARIREFKLYKAASP